MPILLHSSNHRNKFQRNICRCYGILIDSRIGEYRTQYVGHFVSVSICQVKPHQPMRGPGTRGDRGGRRVLL